MPQKRSSKLSKAADKPLSLYGLTPEDVIRKALSTPRPKPAKKASRPKKPQK